MNCRPAVVFQNNLGPPLHPQVRALDTAAAFRQRTQLPLNDCLYALVDFAEVHTEEGKGCLFVAIDRTGKLAFAELRPRAGRPRHSD